MKRTPLVIAALVPIVAIASEQGLDQQQLKNHVQATKVLGAEVQSGDGLDVGTVEDIIFDQQGNISSVLVQREGNLMSEGRERWPGEDEADTDSDMKRAAEDASAEVQRGAERAGAAVERGAEEAGQEWEEATGTGEEEYADADMADIRAERRQRTSRGGEGEGMDMFADPDRAETVEMGDDFAKLQWSDVSYNAEDQVLSMAGEASSLLRTVQYDQSSAQALQGEVRASKLIGLEVNLSDEKSFGEVEDVLIDPRNGRAAALVVDSMEFFDKERYALPVDLQGLNDEEESLTLQMTKQQVEDMGEFEMEEVLSTR